MQRATYRMFSSEAQGEDAAKKDPKDFPEPTEEEKQKYRDAWGLKYDDE